MVNGRGSPPGRRRLGPPPDPQHESPGWTVFSYLLSGMIFYGALGWALGRWVVHSTLLFPIGMVVGLALAVVLVILRFGRPGTARDGKS
jgi:ATP synthase protein I